ncbi:MAG: DUF4190 domain-containing protein [Planctomycetota bacterium]
MSESTEQHSGSTHQVVHVHSAPSNGLGTAGFVTSIVGWVTCGVLCPVGLLMSLVALGKQPRGFAIAGAIIGGLGSGFLFLAGFAIIAGFLGLGAATVAAVDAVGDAAEEFRLQQAEQVIRMEYENSSVLPGSIEGEALIVSSLGSSAEYVRYERVDDTSFELVSAGRDLLFDTEDDVSRTVDVTVDPDIRFNEDAAAPAAEEAP